MAAELILLEANEAEAKKIAEEIMNEAKAKEGAEKTMDSIDDEE